MDFVRTTPREALYYALPDWVNDPLIEDVTRFAAARPYVGLGALMRRFGIGPVRAKELLWALDERHVLLSYVRGWRVASVSPHAWDALYAVDHVEYVTNPGESLRGIAARNLKAPRRWVEIRDLNAVAFPDMGQHDYYPVGAKIKLPGR